MSTTIVVKTRNGQLVAEDFTVPVIAGDTVTFTADGGVAFLCFADETSAILDPSPDNPTELAAGSSATWTFASASPGTYPVIVVGSEDEVPVVIDAEGASAPILVVSVHGKRSINDQTGTGTVDQNP